MRHCEHSPRSGSARASSSPAPVPRKNSQIDHTDRSANEFHNSYRIYDSSVDTICPQTDFRVAVIGAGMAGILSAIKLREHGIDCTVFEKADRVGGTWRDNTYPGLSCDVPAHSYTYTFARNTEWSRWYAEGPEIHSYFERVANDFDVVSLIRFGDEVTDLRFLDSRWSLRTTSGFQGTFDAVIAATGVLHHPNIPHFEGIESFSGACFHSVHWDHSIALDGQRVGVVGTGSTAVQITSALVSRAKRFHLFQRTPQWIYPSPNPFFTEEEKQDFRSDPIQHEQIIQRLRNTMLERVVSAVLDVDSPEHAEVERLCQEHLDTVCDPELRLALTPTYRAMCKRLVVSGDFYEAIQRPNTRLVTAPIERIEPEGVRTRDGILHELDVLVLATGFQVDRFIRPTSVTGRHGIDLDQVWAKAPVAHLSITVPDFPNFFMLNGPNGPVGNFSLIEVAERQMDYTLQLIDGLRARAYREVSPTLEATRRFENERREAAKKTVWVTGCNSWYLDADGVPASWTFSHQRFVEEMSAPKMADFDLRYP